MKPRMAFFVHFYGDSRGLCTISPGLTVIEKNKDRITIPKWVVKTFGAENIVNMHTEVGKCIINSWRPGMLFEDEMNQGLKASLVDRQDEEQVILLLVQKLIDICAYVTPSASNLKAYGHKIRELLLLACTEFESQCRTILHSWPSFKKNQNYTKDYVHLYKICCLSEYRVNFSINRSKITLDPFSKWDENIPSKSLAWYNAYNKVKHDRTNEFDKANLINVINSVAANLVLYCVRFGPYPLFNMQSILSSYINQFFNIYLDNPDFQNFYIPLLKFRENTREDLICFDSHRDNLYLPWVSEEPHDYSCVAVS
jgi:hypothetical protein